MTRRRRRLADTLSTVVVLLAWVVLVSGADPALATTMRATPRAFDASSASVGGTVVTWGTGAEGELGRGTTSSTPQAPGAVAGLADDVVDVHGGRDHVVALTASGQVYTWGSNGLGQLGLGDSADRSVPTAVPGLSDVTAVTTGHDHTMALRSDGTVWTWGLNGDGQLGDGTRTTRRSPVQVSGLSDVSAIAAGRDMSYAIRSDGTAWAWGDDAYGELGDGSTVDRSTPVRVGSLTGVTALAGGRDHGLALLSDGSVWAWGANTYGQVGDATTTNRTSPVRVVDATTEPAGGTIAGVSAGAHHSYALRTDGRVLAWGRDYRAELGDGTTTNRPRPALVPGVSGVVSLGSGRDHGVAVLGDGSVRTWGWNASGQLGDGTTTDRTGAVTVPGVDHAVRSAGGGEGYSVVLVGHDTAPPPNQPPTARASVSCDGLTCAFDGSASSDPDGNVASWSWIFGDGSDPGSGATVSHAFAAAGSYSVTLSVTDDDAAGDTTTQTVTVSDPTAPVVTLDGVRVADLATTRTTLALPAGTRTGDQLVLIATSANASAAATSSGWTTVASVADGTDVTSRVFTRTAAAGDSAVTVTLSGRAKVNLSLLAYAGAGPGVTATGAAEPRSTTQHRAPAAPVATAGSTVVSFWADKVAAAHGWTLPAPVTPRSASSGAGSGTVTSAVGDTADVAAGTWPGATAVAGAASAKAIAWTVVLPPLS